MIRLTDLTLRFVDVSAVSDEALREFYTLLFVIGADLVEIGPAAAQRLGGVLDRARTVLHISHPEEAIPGFVRYSCRAGDMPTPLPLLQEIRVNDVREITLLSRYEDLAGVRIVGLDDLMLQDFNRVFARLRRELSGAVEFCPTNACGCASALLTEWLLEDGGNGAGAFAGAGGFAPLEETLLALELTQKYRKRSDLTVLPRLAALYEQITGVRIPAHKPVLGADIFAVESGVHVDGVLKNAANYEPYPPETVGARRRIIVGKQSGRGSLQYVLTELGCIPVPERLDALLHAVRLASSRLRRALTDDELLALARREGAV